MFLPWIGETHLLPSGLYRRCRSFNGSAICVTVSGMAPMGRGLYRRLGLSPDPEDSGRKCMENILLFQVNAGGGLAMLLYLPAVEKSIPPGKIPQLFINFAGYDTTFRHNPWNRVILR